MNILIDIGHPAHVHLFKHAAAELKSHGHSVVFSVRDIPVAKRLMRVYDMPYIDLGGKKDSLFGKLKTVLIQDFKMLNIAIKNKIDFGLSSGIVIPHVSKLTKMKALTFDDDDDEVEKLVVKYAHPFSDVVFTPSAIKRQTTKALYYSGTHELAYLHPNRFIPDPNVLKRSGIKGNERFFIMRFVAFKGHHDVGQSGLSLNNKRRLIELLSRYGRVIITAERPVEEEFEQYRLPVPPEDIHSLMWFASMFVGDSQTMTTEAALMGIPALKCNTFAGKLSVPNMIEAQGLAYSYSPENFEQFYNKIVELLGQVDLKEQWHTKRDKFLASSIDVTAMIVWFIENYPESKKIMATEHDFYKRFV